MASQTQLEKCGSSQVSTSPLVHIAADVGEPLWEPMTSEDPCWTAWVSLRRSLAWCLLVFSLDFALKILLGVLTFSPVSCKITSLPISSFILVLSLEISVQIMSNSVACGSQSITLFRILAWWRKKTIFVLPIPSYFYNAHYESKSNVHFFASHCEAHGSGVKQELNSKLQEANPTTAFWPPNVDFVSC